MPRPRRRAAYDRVAETDEEVQNGVPNDPNDPTAALMVTSSNSDGPAHSTEATDDEARDIIQSDAETASLDPKKAKLLEKDDKTSEAGMFSDDDDLIRIVVMDPAQRRFELNVNPKWTVEQLKERGVAVHKVAVGSQRLIHRGKMLTDEMTLEAAGIVKDKTIVHLFPRPRVVVASGGVNANGSRGGSDSGCAPVEAEDSGEEAADEVGAHIPQIILDPDEAEMRSSILVLGSVEIIEAQNNVKLLSFLLLVICAMELLALFTVMVGVPENQATESDGDSDSSSEPPDDGIPTGFDDGTVRTWRNSDYFDLALSTFGFYVATLGIKATTENTRRLARRYLICTWIVGIFWNAFYYYLNVVNQKAEEKENETIDEEPLPESDYYVRALLAILLPAIVWVVCCVRAWQFYSLIREAEEEAEERIRNELDLEEGMNPSEPDSSFDGAELLDPTTSSPSPSPQGGEHPAVTSTLT